MATGGKGVSRQQVLALETKRQRLEAEIIQLARDLDAPTEAGGAAPGARGSLLDAEGFPRADIDHFTVHRQRKRLNALKTDLVSITRDIERGLLLVLGSKNNKAARPSSRRSGAVTTPCTETATGPEPASWRDLLESASAKANGKASGGSGGGGDDGGTAAQQHAAPVQASKPPADGPVGTPSGEPGQGTDSTAAAHTAAASASNRAPAAAHNVVTASTGVAEPALPTAALAEVPFAVVNDVAHGGPAQQAGLRVGDKIIAFGTATATNHDGLRKVAEEAQVHNNNGSLRVAVLRAEAMELVELELRPQTWAGRGLIGCHILPL